MPGADRSRLESRYCETERAAEPHFATAAERTRAWNADRKAPQGPGSAATAGPPSRDARHLSSYGGSPFEMPGTYSVRFPARAAVCASLKIDDLTEGSGKRCARRGQKPPGEPVLRDGTGGGARLVIAAERNRARNADGEGPQGPWSAAMADFPSRDARHLFSPAWPSTRGEVGPGNASREGLKGRGWPLWRNTSPYPVSLRLDF